MQRPFEDVSASRVIQRSFWRAHRSDENGNIDESLIPDDIRAWYVGSSDEDKTVSEPYSDLEDDS